MNVLLKSIYRYSHYILIIVTLVVLYIAGLWDTDLGDYTKQINQLSTTGSFINDGQISNRYPPVTSLVYFSAFKILGYAGKGIALLLLHTALALLILRGLELLLKHFGSNTSSIWNRLFTTIVVLNPFILSFIVRGVNSELIFTCCSLFALWFALRSANSYTNILLAGLLTGIALLTRMQGLALCISLALLLLLGYKQLRQTAVFLLVATLTVTPWQYMISKHSGDFIASGGLPSFRDGLSFNNKKYRQPIELPNSVAVLSDSFYHIYYTLKEGAHIEPKQNEMDFVKNYLTNNPATAIELLWLKLKRSFYGTDSQSAKVELLNKVLIGTIILAFVISVSILARRHNKSYNRLLLWIIVYSALTIGMSVMVLSILRYQAPLLPFVFLVCLIAAEKFFDQPKQLWPRKKIATKSSVPSQL